jgi:DNA topoisomerase-1
LLYQSVVRAHANGSSVLLPDIHGAARRAQLRYVASDEPGIRRVRNGKGFRYVRPNGKRVRNANDLARIRSLAIPPAWNDVWICTDENGHLQATGKDARGRTQYRYHQRWREVRDEAKYHDVTAFARALPKLRERVARDLRRKRLTKEKVVATVLEVMERTCIRVGNERYAQTNHSFGLTTLLDRHARTGRRAVEFRFRGKGGKPYRARVRDARLAAIVKRCRDIPGQRLFQYEDDDGTYRPISSTDVNDYLRRTMGHGFTAKTFRTWAGTLTTAVLLSSETPPPGNRGERTVRRAIEKVASQLGNTATVCRKSYVHPDVVDAWRNGALSGLLSRARRAAARGGLRPEERAVLGVLAGRASRPRSVRAAARRRANQTSFR